MKILMAGGGSGGHVTPLRAVMNELRSQSSEDLNFTVVTDRGFYEQTTFLFQDDPKINLRKIYSGKFRRYNSKSLLWHLTHAPTVFKNLRDVLFIAIGVVQSIVLFITIKPDVVFCKGGFVCVPIGIAAKIFNVRLIIHDSDTHPGLTNRFLSRWADKIATGMPTKYYSYPASKTVYTGIPVSTNYVPASKKDRSLQKESLGFKADLPLVLITGGGTGSQVLNKATVTYASELLDLGWQIALITGKNKSEQAKKFASSLSRGQEELFKYYDFTEIAPLVVAADVIVSRAGATAMQEFANAAKAVVIVPSPYLTGAHQLKNAQMFLERNAAIVLQESELFEQGVFVNEIVQISKNLAVANTLHTNFAKPRAAKELAQLILDLK